MIWRGTDDYACEFRGDHAASAVCRSVWSVTSAGCARLARVTAPIEHIGRAATCTGSVRAFVSTARES